MNAEQRKQTLELIESLKSTDAELSSAEVAALLQELIDAPEPEPVAVVSNFFTGRTLILANKGIELPDGAPLYTAPPAPSAPDGWKNAAEWLRNNYQDYPNISSLCEAMVAQSANNGSN